MVNNKETKNCVLCFKKANIWTGFILKNGEKILAGWCSEKCLKDNAFKGHYKKEMGLELDE